ncbi:MAG: lactate dehydrogenase [Chloroflexi bacterium]|nr:lactate dehydrogenase [Chloroflexota bacterium]
MPKAKVVFLSSLPTIRGKELVEMAPPDMEVVAIDNTLPDSQKIPLCKDADAIIVVPADLSVNVLRACPKVKLIQTLSAGYDRLDLKAIGEMGIPVANNGGSNAISVAEQTIALMIATSKHFVRHWQSAKNRRWREEVQNLEAHEISGKTVGIVGLGRIGRQVAKRLRGFDCNVVYYDVLSFPEEVNTVFNARPVPLDHLLRTSDFVTLHVPLNRSTRHMIGRRELAMMKPTAILISTCRGPVVDEKALYETLKAGKIKAAGLDVLEVEPTPKDNPLFDLDNAVITPHMAGSSVESNTRGAAFAFHNIRRVLEGKTPESLVTPE